MTRTENTHLESNKRAKSSQRVNILNWHCCTLMSPSIHKNGCTSSYGKRFLFKPLLSEQWQCVFRSPRERTRLALILHAHTYRAKETHCVLSFICFHGLIPSVNSSDLMHLRVCASSSHECVRKLWEEKNKICSGLFEGFGQK